jgi:hypothetical protein
MPVCTVAIVGETDTANGVVRVTTAEADFVVSEADVAVTVTVAGDGAVAGAV